MKALRETISRRGYTPSEISSKLNVVALSNDLLIVYTFASNNNPMNALVIGTTQQNGEFYYSSS